MDDADERMVPSSAVVTEPQKRMIAEKIRGLFEEALALRSLGQRRYVPSFVPSSFSALAVAAVTLKAGP